MLTLSRKVGETIVVGDNIRVTVTKVSGRRVALGVEAPKQVRVLRGELSSPSLPASRREVAKTG